MNWPFRDRLPIKLKIIFFAGLTIIFLAACDGAKVVRNPEDHAASNACEVVQEIEEAIGTNAESDEAEPSSCP